MGVIVLRELDFLIVPYILFKVSFGMSIWQQISKEFFSKLYPSEHDVTTISSTKSTTRTTSTIQKKSSGKVEEKATDTSGLTSDDKFDNGMMESSTKHYRHMTLSRGLSKYGPWGYLILGMLLCGGALLVCVLWGKAHSYTLCHNLFVY